MPVQTPTAGPLASGVQQSSATISAGLANVKLVAADGVTPLLYRTQDAALALASYSVDQQLLPSALRTSIISASPASVVSGIGLILALTISSAPNTSETLQLRWYPAINGNVNAPGASGTFAASLISALGSALQAAPPYTFFLWLYPGASATFDNTTFHKLYSLSTPRLWTAEIKPSAASNWTYQLDYGALN